ncbi:DUF3987 domain-containing protein [bacterium]|nr:MAG: DUF3987 domain-containing protein [bacterium]
MGLRRTHLLPPDFIVIPALISLASLVGKTVFIRPKRYDDWPVIPNLWGATVGTPSRKKSPAASEALKPLVHLQATAIEEHKETLKAWKAEAMLREFEKGAAKDSLKALVKKGQVSREKLMELSLQASDDAEAEEEPAYRTYYVQDGTIEANGVELAKNPRGFLLSRDELMGFLQGLNKQGREQDRAFYIEAFNGNGQFTYKRIGRGTLHIPNVCLSLFGTIQPGPLTQLIRSAEGAGQDGFIARFQLLVYPDCAPYRHVDRYPNKDAKARAYDVFRALDKLSPEMVGATIEEDGGAFLRFSPDAQAIFNEWLQDLEERLPHMGSLLEQHTAKYRSLMPSLALIFYLIGVVDGTKEPGAVDEEACAMAVAWCEYLEGHARRIYGAAMDPATESAETLGARLIDRLPAPFTARDVQRRGWTGLTEREEVERALLRLEERGWIRSEDVVVNPEKGGRPSRQYWTNPAIEGQKQGFVSFVGSSNPTSENFEGGDNS